MRTKLLILIAIIGVATLAAIYIANAGKERSSAVPRIIISPATTYIVTPLKPDGHIDYIAAINQKMSEGVTPENNAVVQFWEAVGSGAVDSAIRTPYFKMLGVPAPPQNVHVLAGLRAAVVTSTPVPTTDPANPPAAATIESQLHDAIGRPWSQPEFPQLAAWLTANEKSANAIAQSSQRLRFYSPLVSSGNKSLLIYALLPADGEFSEGARVLAARGMLRLSQGEIEKALQDSLSLHRLARLVGQGPTLIDAVMAMHVEGLANHLDLAIAEHSALSLGTSQRLSQQIKALPPLPDVAQKLDVFERFSLLEIIASLEDKDSQIASPDGSRGFRFTGGAFIDASRVDLNDALRRANAWSDRIVQVVRLPNVLARKAALGDLLNSMQSTKDALQSAEQHLKDMNDDELSRWCADKIVADFSPATTSVVSSHDRLLEESELVHVSLALSACHIETKSYPAKLMDLVPRYIGAIPKDQFSGQELHYAREGAGYLLYSVGPNGVDDGGRGLDSIPEGDDIVVRVPRKAPDKSATMP